MGNSGWDRGDSYLQRGRPPLYLRVANDLRAAIAAEGLEPGDRLPSERELAASLQVSRVTLRSALKALEQAGAVRPAAARGWFLNEKPAALDSKPGAPGIDGFTRQGVRSGLIVSSKVLEAECRRATLNEAEALRVAPGSELFVLHRVRYLDGLVIAIDHTRIATQIAPMIVTLDFSTASLYETLRSLDPPVIPTTAEYSVEAALPARDEASLLEITDTTPLLVATQATYDQHGTPLDLGRTAYRGDRYRFRARIGT